MTASGRNESVPQPHVHVALQDESRLTDPRDDELYTRACAALAERDLPAQTQGGALLLLLTMVLFAVAALWFIGFDPLTWWFLPLLIGVLFLHEAGHYLGMRIFGYRDLRMFFIPFFGAAVSGQKYAAPAWQQAIVLLLGPLPGIVVGALLCVFPPPWLTIPLAYFLLMINGFNLLPFAPLDGGRLLQSLIFSRHPLSESALLLFSAVGLAVLGWMVGSWVLGGLAVVVLVGVPAQYRRRRQGTFLQQELPPGLGDLSKVHRRALFRCARLFDPNSTDPSKCANEMKAFHEEAVRKRAGIITSLALLTVYAAAAIIVLWSLSLFFYWGEAESPGEWSQRRIEALVKGELNLDEISLIEVAPGTYIGTGQTAQGTEWTLKILQDQKSKSLKWSAARDNGEKRVGGLSMTEGGLLVDETIR